MNVYPLKCRVRAAGTVTRVDVYDDIGAGDWFGGGLTAKDFAAQLAGVKGPLEVHVNSAGGDVFDGIAIKNALSGHNWPVTAVVDGLAASIASVIVQSAGERVAEPGSMMMIHDAFGACLGDAAEMTQMAAALDKVSGNIAAIYAERAGRDAGYWREQMRAETWYTAEEAVDEGLADRVGDGAAQLPAGLDLAAFTALPGRIAAQLRGLPQAAAGPGRPLGEAEIRAIAREEIHVANAAVDESPWDGNAAMSACSSAADYRSICAGEHTGGDADERQHWALPHHKRPGAPPNRHGVDNALSRLPQTQDLANRSAAEAHLHAHQSAMGSGSSSDHGHAGFVAMTPERHRNLQEAAKALKGAQ